jgi:hypothetical protein
MNHPFKPQPTLLAIAEQSGLSIPIVKQFNPGNRDRYLGITKTKSMI